MTAYRYLCFNDQVGFQDEAAQTTDQTYQGPDDFDAGGNQEQARAFLVWWLDYYDMAIEDFQYEIKFWDGRTLVAELSDESVSHLTFIFEAY